MVSANLLKNGVLFRLKNTCRWGNTAKVKLNESAVLELIGPAPATMTPDEADDRLAKAMIRLKGGQRLLVSPEYDAIKKYQSETKKRILNTYANPSYIDDGLYTVKADCVDKVAQELHAAQEHLRLFLVTAFADALPEQKEAAKPVLGELFKDSLYPDPSDVYKLFDISWRFVQLDIPEGLPPEIREEEERKLRDTYEKAEQAIISALWAEFQGFLDHIVERLTPGDDGKKKKFNGDILGGLASFVEAFNNRNMFNDERLEALVARANEIVKNASNGDASLKDTGEKLRNDDVLRLGVMESLKGIKVAVEESIATLPVRAIELEEEVA